MVLIPNGSSSYLVDSDSPSTANLVAVPGVKGNCNSPSHRCYIYYSPAPLSSHYRNYSLHYGEHITIDNLIVKVKEGSENPYSVLNNYAVYLLKGNNVSNLTLKQWIVTVKNFLEYHDVDISPRKFKLKVSSQKSSERKKKHYLKRIL